MISTEEEAIKMVSKINSEYNNSTQKLWFCPLINMQCNIKCLCYVPARYTVFPESSDSILYQVYNPYCSNYMFTGDPI